MSETSSKGFQVSPDEEKQLRENMAIVFDKYKDKVATLPKEKGWITETLYKYQGFWFQSKRMYSVESVMASQDTFESKPTDIYLTTIPKSGTTWLKALVFALVNRNQYKNDRLSSHPLLTTNPHLCVPGVFLELYKNTPSYADSHSPRIFATHMPYTVLPQSIRDSGCRLVYLCRNPKDVLVSFFHFANKLRDKALGVLTLEEAFGLFSKGVSPHGSYWDHVIEYYNASLQHPEQVMFLTYEELTANTVNTVRRLAKFIGCPFTKEEDEEGVVEEIVKLCSFDALSEANKHGDMMKGVPNNSHFRSGKVGDWTNHLSGEMSRTLDQITKEKFDGLDISF